MQRAKDLWPILQKSSEALSAKVFMFTSIMLDDSNDLAIIAEDIFIQSVTTGESVKSLVSVEEPTTVYAATCMFKSIYNCSQNIKALIIKFY